MFASRWERECSGCPWELLVHGADFGVYVIVISHDWRKEDIVERCWGEQCLMALVWAIESPNRLFFRSQPKLEGRTLFGAVRKLRTSSQKPLLRWHKGWEAPRLCVFNFNGLCFCCIFCYVFGSAFEWSDGGDGGERLLEIFCQYLLAWKACWCTEFGDRLGCCSG